MAITSTITLEKIYEEFGTRTRFDEKKYIPRTTLEQQLEMKLGYSKCLFICGNSGSGKTWLITHVLNKNTKDYKFINLASANNVDGLDGVFRREVGKILEGAGISGSGSATFKLPIVAEANAEVNGELIFKYEHDSYREYLKNNQSLDYIIFDNFENIINNPNVVSELGNIITLSDDPDIQRLNIKIILIGANSDIDKLFELLPNYETISNRITEFKKVKAFSYDECALFVQGAFRRIGFTLFNENAFSKYIFDSTLGVPQSVKDLCLKIAEKFYISKESTIDILDDKTKAYMEEAQQDWLKESFAGEYHAISTQYQKNVESGREYQNMILFSLLYLEKPKFTADVLFSVLETHFQDDIGKTGIKKVKEYIKELANSERGGNILEGDGDGMYQIKSYKTKLGLKLILKDNIRGGKNRIEIIEIDDLE